jgi:hypothetical protein
MTYVAIGPCKVRLAQVWLAGGAVLYCIVLAQSLLGYYGDEVADAWSWLLPTTLPTLSLIVGVLVADAQREPKKTEQVNRFVFQLAMGLSAFYLTVVLLTLLVQPVIELAPPEVMKRSNLWLAPLQGLVAAALGAFYTSPRPVAP